jgi:phosphate transport system protein
MPEDELTRDYVTGLFGWSEGSMTQHTDPPHTLRTYDEDLEQIRTLLRTQAEIARQQVVSAVDAMTRRDIAGADLIVGTDAAIDQLQSQVEHDAIVTIGRRAPVADDLREIIGAIKIAGELERVGDYAKNIAKRIPDIAETPPVEPAVIIPEIADLVSVMVADAFDAYLKRDAEQAIRVIKCDAKVDKFYNSLFRALLVHMIENPKHTTQAVHLLFVAKNLERIGDHATNVAEVAYYLATGNMIESRSLALDSVYDPAAGNGTH